MTGGWRKLRDDELHDLYFPPDTIFHPCGTTVGRGPGPPLH